MKRMIILFTICLLTFGIVSSKSVTAVKEKKKQKVSPGIEVLLKEEKNVLSGKKVGLITNPTGIDSKLTSIVDLLHDDPDINLTALFGPEHGVRGDAQAGASVEYYIDEKTGLPVYSLYGKTKKPTPEMLKDVEVLVFDIQDVGTRYYTYIYTMAYAMEAAKENDIPFIVLDRPNPQGGESVDGPVLEPEFSSFVGLYPIPLKHGMTVGELATLFNKEFNIGADLKVIKMKGWKRDMDYDDTGLPFVLPSPNMPAVSTTFVYPATGLIEGTNVSEGRGTTKPFELIGAPYINSDELAGKLNELRLPGVKFRAASFTPTFSKHAGKLSHGVEIYITDREEFKAVPTGLHIIKTIQDLYPDDFEFLAAKNFNLLIGNGWVMSRIEEGSSVNEIMKEYQVKQDAFKKVRKNYLLYK
ncbi:exo-beta-N-acetylmuramidase NamZ domain-containing protein [Peribacillus frigoritolerans]|uniref:exo-beta-N-acetylmuramidase NamZ family protein n=1 Tax=Peribacillus frigoritolerans TaxID=450367 RepID=UPI0037C5DE8E